jgi:hypothetical protein
MLAKDALIKSRISINRHSGPGLKISRTGSSQNPVLTIIYWMLVFTSKTGFELDQSFRGLIITSVFIWITPVHAHHNPTSHYIIDKMITVTGVVTKFRLINPHARIYFDVTTIDGEIQHWLAEGNAAAILLRRGWNKTTLKPGDIIEISGYPAKDGGHKVDWKLIVLEDGTELRGGNTTGVEKQRLFQDIEKRRRQQRSQP